MINISFANPYLLLVLIPMLALVLVPYFIAIRKENKTKATTISLVLHIVIVLLAVLAAAGMSNVTVITETELYVVADVSYSTHDKLDLIDDYIEKIEDELPRNSEMGVITFGKNYRLHTPLGERFTTVKENKVNDSATDIASALRYASTLFSDSAIKRIVLITDGMSTDPSEAKTLVRMIEDLKYNNIYIDAVYVDTATTDIKEVQLSGVDFIDSTYAQKDTVASVLVESSYATNAVLSLMKDGERYLEKAVQLTVGYNVVNFELDTSESGEHDYIVSVHSNNDAADKNNSLSFTQTVSDEINVLLVTSTSDDVNYVKDIYGEKAVIDAFVKPKDPTPTMSNPNPKPVPFNVPFTVEELCKYDEIIISNVDVRSITSADTFIKSLDTLVSLFGKTLITAGNTHIQNKEDNTLNTLQDMLPVKFGNSDADPKLYTLVIDSSRSMEFKNADYFVMAKLAATYLLGLLNENDYFSIIHFSGEVYPLVAPKIASQDNITAALVDVARLDVTQGTMIGAALKAAGDMMIPMNFSEKQLILISDGMSFEGGETLQDNPLEEATKLSANNIVVSALNTGNTDGEDTMKSIAFNGGGNYYFCPRSSDLEKLVLDEVADDVNATEIEGKASVNVARPNDSVLSGVIDVPDIYGYVFAKTKASAETVLTTTYKKSGGGEVEVPIYAYWSYGNGKVATFTTNLGGKWLSGWDSGDGAVLLNNVANTNLPETKVNRPYTIDVEFDGKYSHLEIIPASINPDAKVTATIVMPDGSEIKEKLIFDSYRYFARIDTEITGKYVIKISYELINQSYSSEYVYTTPYSPEYDRFSPSSPTAIYSFMRNNGNVFENDDIVLEVDEDRIATYVLYFTVPFIALAALLFVVDTIIRKLKWADIVSLFKKIKKEDAK